MQYAESVLDLIGGTPLVRLSSVTRELGPDAPLVLAKVEFVNPGGSVKDRIAVRMVDAAEASGALKPGGTIVEPTSGNTGIGLALVAQQRGYHCIFVCPDKVAEDKVNTLRAYGAEVVVCPTAVAPEHPDSYYSTSDRLMRETPNAWKPDQYSNPNGPLSHYETTGPEIWTQTDGRVTHFVTGVGTGGTISGTGRYLKEASAGRVQVIGADPEGSVLSGDVARPYLTEGVGEDFLPGTFDPATVDRWVRVSDRDAFAMARRITREEGILAGESCGTAMIATLDLVRELAATDGGNQAVIVTLLPDGGRNYLSKLYNDEWMRANGLLPTTGAIVRISELLRDRHRDPEIPDVVIARTTDRVGAAIDLLQLYGISQLPVSEQPEGDDLTGIVGSVNERGLLDRAYRNPSVVERTIGEIMDRPLPTLGVETTLDDAFAILSDGADALLALRGERPAGVVTKLDLLEYIAHRGDSDH